MQLTIDESMNSWINDLTVSNKSHYLNTLLHIGHLVSTQIQYSSNTDHTDKLLTLQQEKTEDCMSSTVAYVRDIMNSLGSRMDMIEQRTSQTVETSQERMLEMVETFTGKTKTSSSRGDLAENCIEEILKTEFRNDTVKRSSGQAHEADLQLHSTMSPSIIFESKNYTTIVQKKEIDKFKSDMVRTNINYGIFFSFNSRISGKHNMDMERFDDKFILYVSNTGFNEDIIIMATNIMKSFSQTVSPLTSCLTKNVVQNKIQGIIEALSKLNVIMSCLTKTKATLLDEETNIRKSLDNIHTAYIYNESEMKRIIDTIQSEVNYTLEHLNNYNSIDNDGIEILLEHIDERKKEHVRAIITQISASKYTIKLDSEDSKNLIIYNAKETIVAKLCVKAKIKLLIPTINVEFDYTKKNSLCNIKLALNLIHTI